MTAVLPSGYFNRTDAAKNYEKHLFIAGAGLQSAELNEIQDNASNRIRSVADALFKDGDIVRDARLVVNPLNGSCLAESGAVYLRGAVRGVPSRSFNISNTGLVTVGVYLVETVISVLNDPTLRDPASGTRNYQESGAMRLQLNPVWGFSGERSDGDFFPVYVVENGILRAKEAPPSMDSVAQAISRYDRDSAGGTYVVSGLICQDLPDVTVSGQKYQVYSVSDGRARVRGQGIEFQTSTRMTFAYAPDLKNIVSEPRLSTTNGSQRINLNRTPVESISSVRITAEVVESVVHGAYQGVSDPLSHNSVLQIVSVTQGGTTFVAGTDYVLTADKVDWSPAGTEPANGSTYQVTYRYITVVTPTAVDQTGFTVTGAVNGTLVLVDYNQYMKRYDRICVSDAGELILVRGVSADWSPLIPSTPENLLPLATVYQTWDGKKTVTNDSVRVVPMVELSQINSRIDHVLQLVARQQLASDVSLRETAEKKGLFTDAFLDDSQRDAGIAQTAAVFDGIMTLPIAATLLKADNRGANATTFLNKSEVASVQQISKTGSMLVNPYMAFGVMPSNVTLNPSIDRWVDVQTTWTSPVTRSIVVAFYSIGLLTQVQSVSVNNVLLSSQVQILSNLRQIDVEFSVSGFGPGETLASVQFDGLEVTPVSL